MIKDMEIDKATEEKQEKKKKKRRRRKKPEIKFHILVILFALLLLIPLAFWWYGVRHADATVPEYATGYVTEISGSEVFGTGE